MVGKARLTLISSAGVMSGSGAEGVADADDAGASGSIHLRKTFTVSSNCKFKRKKLSKLEYFGHICLDCLLLLKPRQHFNSLKQLMP